MKTEDNCFLVMYDITHPKTLQKVSKLLLKSGMERVNYSVWVGWVNPARQTGLKETLTELISSDLAKGSLFYILPVTTNTIKKMRCLNGRKPKELDFWVGEKRSMFF